MDILNIKISRIPVQCIFDYLLKNKNISFSIILLYNTKDITAFPHSCNILDGVKDDVRTPDKLIDGVNDTFDGRHMWLAPVFSGQV